MDNPTLDVNMIEEQHSEDTFIDELLWATFLPVGQGFSKCDLIEDTNTFGRNGCDFCFSSELDKNHHYRAFSKCHFTVYRERKGSDTGYNTFIQDMSTNGTFLNGEKIGKNQKRAMMNNDVISLAVPNNKAYVFYDIAVASASKRHYPKELIKNYDISRELGSGACGVVKLAFDKKTCQKYAVKIIKKKNLSFTGGALTSTSRLMQEVKILKSLHHPCMTTVEDVYDSPEALCIVLELAEGGELFDRVVKYGKYAGAREQEFKVVFYQLLEAVKYLHANNISHRDLKLENVLLKTDEPYTLVKLTDFGLARIVGDKSLMTSYVGTPTYLAPEVLVGNQSYNKAVDLWSLGVVLYVCLAGYQPFTASDSEVEDADTIEILKSKVLSRQWYKSPDEWKDVSDEAKDLVRGLMQVEASDRLSLDEALAHPWLADDNALEIAKNLMYPEKFSKKRTADDQGNDVNKKPTTVSPNKQ